MLRPYQEKAITSIIDGYNRGIRQQLIAMATGTGKTQIFSHLPAAIKSTVPGKILVLAHRSELIDQAIDKLRAANPCLKVVKEMAGSIADPNADIIVASVATLGRKGTKRADKFDWNKISVVITDECHHSTASSYSNIYELADVIRPDTHKLHIGFTATPQRGDGTPLAQVYKKIVFAYPIRQAIEDGWLVEIRGYKVSTGTSLDGIKISQGDYDQTQLSNTVNTPKRNQLVAKAWLEHAENRQTIGFTVDIQHAKDLAEVFVHYGIKAEAVWGDDPERPAKLARHKSGETTVLFNCGVLIEGYDDWRIGCVILAGPTKSPVKFTQMVGRGTRLQDGTGNLLIAKEGWTIDDGYLKTDCIVIDVVDASSRNSLVTLPTLMGMSAKLDLKGQGIVAAVTKLEDAQKQYPHIDFNQLEDITQLESHIENVNLFEVKFPPEVEGNSQLSWYPSPSGGYVLLLPDKDRVAISQNILDKWEISGNIKGNRYKGERDTIEAAFSAADDLVSSKCSEALKVLRREETWHKQPASAAQLKLLAKFFKGKAIPLDLDKGKASKLISSYLAGKQ